MSVGSVENPNRNPSSPNETCHRWPKIPRQCHRRSTQYHMHATSLVAAGIDLEYTSGQDSGKQTNQFLPRQFGRVELTAWHTPNARVLTSIRETKLGRNCHKGQRPEMTKKWAPTPDPALPPPRPPALTWSIPPQRSAGCERQPPRDRVLVLVPRPWF